LYFSIARELNGTCANHENQYIHRFFLDAISQNLSLNVYIFGYMWLENLECS
jgi:hypothetical protein